MFCVSGVTPEYLNMVFILDTTGSMAPFINEAIKNIEDQTTRITQEMKNSLTEYYGDVRKFVLHTKVSVVAYRDTSDSKQIEFCPPTTDTNSIKAFLQSLVPSGGFDEPEDILSAIDFVFTNIEFPEKDSEESNHTSTVFLIVADAPAHGMFMHNSTMIDDVIRQDDEELWITYLEKMRLLNIDLVCVQLTSDMDKMISFLQTNYDRDDIYKMQLVKQTTGNMHLASAGLERCTVTAVRTSIGRRDYYEPK